jgi:putative tryptophan/tyrosine transport system substrate-binding protein
MQRREFIMLIGGAAAWPSAACAQQPNRMRRVGALLTGAGSLIDVLARELENLGWSEGRNVHIELRTHTGDPSQLRADAAGLVRLSPDVIFTTSPVEAKVLRQETSSIPIVFAVGVDPVSQGVIHSFAHPGGNITGCSSFEFSMGGKWVQNLKEIAPNIRRIGVFFNPRTAPYIQSIIHSVESAAGPSSVKISAIPVQDLAEFEHAVASFAQEPDGGIIFPPDIFLAAKIQAIIALVAQYHVPAVYSIPAFATLGGLVAYGPDIVDNYRRAANLVDRILRGAKPGDLPVEQPTKFQLVINLKTAKALGLAVSPSLLASADEVIE